MEVEEADPHHPHGRGDSDESVDAASRTKWHYVLPENFASLVLGVVHTEKTDYWHAFVRLFQIILGGTPWL